MDFIQLWAVNKVCGLMIKNDLSQQLQVQMEERGVSMAVAQDQTTLPPSHVYHGNLPKHTLLS